MIALWITLGVLVVLPVLILVVIEHRVHEIQRINKEWDDFFEWFDIVGPQLVQLQKAFAGFGAAFNEVGKVLRQFGEALNGKT